MPTGAPDKSERKQAAERAAKDLQRETRAMAAVVNNFLSLSPKGRAYIMPQLTALVTADDA